MKWWIKSDLLLFQGGALVKFAMSSFHYGWENRLMSAGAQAILNILDLKFSNDHVILQNIHIFIKCCACVLPKCSKMTFRDCGLTCHKPCHVRVDNHCLQTSLPNMELWAHHQIYQFLSIWNIPMIPSMTWSQSMTLLIKFSSSAAFPDTEVSITEKRYLAWNFCPNV